MKIVVAMDSFKGSLDAPAACRAVARGLREADPSIEVVLKPMADGGEGTARAVLEATGGRWVAARAMGPLPEMTVDAGYAWWPGDPPSALVEMAAASGLPLLRPEQRDPLRATTFGTGQLLAAAVARGARRIRLAIGGSATVDGGTGAAAATGWQFLDARGRAVPPGGGALSRIRRILPPPAPLGADVEVLCDVDCPLLGPRGAARVFGPQKGATPAMVERLEAGLAHLSEQVESQLGVRVAGLSGAGAAGGLGAGAAAFFGARLVPGIDTIVALTDLAGAARGAAWVIAGEGAFDRPSLYGKVVSGVARVAREAGARMAVFAGRVDLPRAEWEAAGVASAESLVGPGVTPEEAVAKAGALLRAAARRWAAERGRPVQGLDIPSRGRPVERA